MRVLLVMALALLIGACSTADTKYRFEVSPTNAPPAERLKKFEREVTRQIEREAEAHKAVIGVSISDDTVHYAYNGDRLFHAASTMKVPVMVAVFRAADQGQLSLDEELMVETTFASMIDGTPYTVAPGNVLGQRVGEKMGIRPLLREMIQVSDNVATNLLLARVGTANVTRAMRDLGSKDGYVIRALEDEQAFRFDLSNRLSPDDLTNLMKKINSNEAASALACAEMRDILVGQQIRTMLPKLLPQGTKVAHKTGNITRNSHDTGIVTTDVGTYCITIMCEGVEDQAVAEDIVARLSEYIYTRWRFLRE